MTNWSKQEDEALKAGYEAGRSVCEIAEAVGRTPGAVRGRASALGISKAKVEAMQEIGFEGETTCPYCGQIQLMGGECDCPGARRARKI